MQDGFCNWIQPLTTATRSPACSQYGRVRSANGCALTLYGRVRSANGCALTLYGRVRSANGCALTLYGLGLPMAVP